MKNLRKREILLPNMGMADNCRGNPVKPAVNRSLRPASSFLPSEWAPTKGPGILHS